MTGQHWTVNSDASLENFITHLRELYSDKKYVQVKWSTGKQRTLPQNNSIHLYCEHLAAHLNASGFDMKRVLAHKMDIPWSKQTAKEFIWNEAQKGQFNKVSSTKLERDEVTQVYDVLNRFFSDKFGLHVPFPSGNKKDAA